MRPSSDGAATACSDSNTAYVVWKLVFVGSHLKQTANRQFRLYNPLHMLTLWQKLGRIGRAYLWSILLWAWFAPIMAGQEKIRLLADGIVIPFWKMLLIAAAWCMTAATLAPPIFYIVRRYPISRPIRAKRVAGYLLGAIPYLLVSVCVRSLLLPPWDPNTGEFTRRTFETFVNNARLFATQIWDYLVVLVAAHAYEYFTRARNQELERAKLQQALAESELQALKSQLQPHFLFNTLHGISTLIEVDKTRAREMVLKLSSLLRTVLQDGTADLIPLKEELKFAEAYLDIEKMRLGDRLEICWKIAPDMRELLVPPLILQPLVENAIVHGVACSREGGWLEIGVRRVEKGIELSVRNSVRGKGTPGSGLGLQNTKARLKYLYGDEASVDFAVSEDGTANAKLYMPALGTSKPEVGEEAVVPVRSTAG
jgi:two-component system, LytTR family, sensor kinase